MSPGREHWVQIEGHGRIVRLSDYSNATRLGSVAGPNAHAADLLVSSDGSGTLATAHVSSVGPAESAASEPSGRVAEAGVHTVTDGPDGDWQIRFRGVHFPWPEGVILRVPPDNHPGDMLPIYLSRTTDTDEMVMLFAGFTDPPRLDDFIAGGQEVLVRDDTPGAEKLEVADAFGADRWHQRFDWVQASFGLVVVRTQQIEGSGAGLEAVAKAVGESLAE